ncbi:MAG: hypothetical protein GY797_41530 [Deltaproteobacteria bacterium]|nr:hypothetical protein [Deltaproteobacteria bacterium]
MLAIERVELDGPEVVYNFTVKGPHTYFVLEVGVLVHNCGTGPKADVNDRLTTLGGFTGGDEALGSLTRGSGSNNALSNRLKGATVEQQREALLIGGAYSLDPVDDGLPGIENRSLQVIRELADNYPNVTVVDKADHLKLTKMLFKKFFSEEGKRSHVQFKKQDAINFATEPLDDVDIFAVGADRTLMRDVPELAERMLEKNSKMLIPNDISGTREHSNAIANLKKKGFNVEVKSFEAPLELDMGSHPNPLVINSKHFVEDKVSPLTLVIITR